MRQFLVFVGCVALVAAGRAISPPAEPEHPRVEPEPVQMAAAIQPAQPAMPEGQQPQPAAPQGG
ncbi:MAG: hypothetical protein U0269_07775 [Polyangiales bacterium]|jgi:hypothetical protein